MWQPEPDRAAATNMQRFLDLVRLEYAPEVENWHGLWRWSVEHPERFWTIVWAYCGIKADSAWAKVLENPDRMPGARWFPGARLNFAENLLRYRDDRPALVFRGEDGSHVELSYAQLHAEVARVASGLRAAGVQQGDRVAGFLPNRPETVVAMLATASIGAIWSSCSPDFGINGVLDRFGQIEPKVLFTADGYVLQRQDTGFAGTDPWGARPAAVRRACRRHSLCERASGHLRPVRRGALGLISALPVRHSPSSNCHSTTRCTSCIRPGPRASRSASCMAPVAH
jgi:non-ribosomal peptide synthetase component F